MNLHEKGGLHPPLNNEFFIQLFQRWYCDRLRETHKQQGELAEQENRSQYQSADTFKNYSLTQPGGNL